MAEKFTKEQIFDELKKILVEELEINDGDIVPEANLFEDLDLDSIDAVDICIIGRNFKIYLHQTGCSNPKIK